MPSLILTIICSTSIALLLKHNDFIRGNRFILLAANYFVAAIIALVFLFLENRVIYSIEVILFGMFVAFLFVSSIYFFSKAVETAGAALATVSSRLSVIIPFLLSILIFSEKPSLMKIIGFTLAMLTILLFYFSIINNNRHKTFSKDYIFLILVLVGIGVADFCMKIFQFSYSIETKPVFLLSIFSFSFIIVVVFILLKGIKFEKKSFILGSLLGIPNIFSSFFLINALVSLPAVFVYPVVNVSVIILTTLIVVIYWKEKLNLMGKISIVVGIISVVLLSL